MKLLAGAISLLLAVSEAAFSQQTPSTAPVTPSSSASGTSLPSVVSGAAPAQKARIFVTESDSWQMAGGSGGAGRVFGGGFSGGASPQTAEVIKTIGQRCPNLIVNDRVDASDYVILLEHEGGKGLLRKKDKVAVFQQRSGDSIYSASTLSVGGSVQGACESIAKDWITYSAQPPTSAPPQPAPVMAAGASQMAVLVVESSVPGADIEIDGSFVGNTPSTLSVTPGQHTVTVKKKGYEDWSRQMNVSGNSVHLDADLTAKPAGS